MTLLEDQISTLRMLLAMYPLASELLLSAETTSFVYDGVDPKTLTSFDMTLSLHIDDDQTSPLEVGIQLPLLPENTPPNAKLGIRQPSWLPRSEYEGLLDTIPIPVREQSSGEYVLPILSNMPIDVMAILSRIRKSDVLKPDKVNIVPSAMGRMGWREEERVWYWFPSLSSKDKRRDLVEYAEEVGITGFVLAGKPGLLCVEGDGRAIDKYMSRIRSESWADVPAFQKKVTERLRRPVPCPANRLFPEMKDVTDQVRHTGQYNHRGDMSEVKKMMDEWGVGDDFQIVVMNGGKLD